MRNVKQFSRLLMMAAMMFFAACEPNNVENPNENPNDNPPAPEPPALTLAIELSDLGINTVTMTVTPSEEEAIYLYDVIQQSILAEHHEGSVATYVRNLVASALEEMKTPEAVLERIGTKGESSYVYKTLSPETDYVAFAIALNMNCEAVGEATTENFTTLPMPEVCSWNVSFDEIYYDGVTFTVTPSDDTIPYYFAVRPQVSYGNIMSDAELLDAILMEDAMMIDYYLVTGEYESLYEMQEFILCADTGYDVLVFAYSDGAPLTSIKRFPFRTLGSEAENVTFEIDVTPTSNGAEVAVAPSDEHTMYMWDVVDKSDLINTYNGDISIYVDAYIDAMIEDMGLYELDFARVMGNDNTTISHAFEPSTDYLVWAARVDEFGEVVGEITTKEFTTLADETTTLTTVAPKEISFKVRSVEHRGSRQ